MKTFEYRGKKHRSRSAAAVEMLKRTKRSQSVIAKIVGITPQTVNALKRIHKLRAA